MSDCMTIMRKIGQGDIGGLYVFHGAEIYLMEKTVEQIRKKLIPEETVMLDYQEEPGKGLSVDDLCRLLGTPAFMAERRLLVIRDDPRLGGRAEEEEPADEDAPAPAKGKARSGAKAAKAEKEQFLKSLHPGVCLIFLQKDSFRAAGTWAKFLKEQKGCEIVEFPLQKSTDAAPWILRMAREAGVRISRDTAAFLHEFGKGTLLDDEAEMHKLASYVGENGEITKREIQELAIPSLEYKIFALTDQLLSGHAGEAMLTLDRLLEDGEKPSPMIALIGTRIRTGLAAEQAKASRMAPGDAARAMGMNPYSVEIASRQRSKLTENDWLELMKLCSNADMAFKQGRAGDEESLRCLVAAIAQKMEA